MSLRGLSLLVVAVAAMTLPAVATAQRSVPAGPETVVDLRVHGNHSIPDDEVLALAGVALGDVVTPELVETVTDRLQASGYFETVEVRKRYRTLTATDRVALVIVVRERPATSIRNAALRSVVGLLRQTLFLPMVRYDEGYGLTYGARFALVDIAGAGSRVSVPATWGADRQVAFELEAPLPGRIVDRLLVGASRGRRRHPALGLTDDRTGVRVGVDRNLPQGFRMHATVAREEVRFASAVERLTRAEAAVTYNSAVTSFPRDEVALTASVERIALDGDAAPIVRPRIDAQVFVGVIGQSVVAARFRYEGASRGLPLYEQPLLGGGATLRGWPVGVRMGDRLLATSLEWRLPVTSPLSAGNAGLRFFYDRATVWNVGSRLRDATFLDGAGVGLFVTAPLFEVHVDVAHDLRGSVRLHAGVGTRF